MEDVKCIALSPEDLPEGQILAPGQTGQTDIAHPEVRAKIDAGRLLPLGKPGAIPDRVEDVLAWAADDPHRATVALNAERAKPAREQRSTLIDKLTPLTEPDNTPEVAL